MTDIPPLTCPVVEWPPFGRPARRYRVINTAVSFIYGLALGLLPGLALARIAPGSSWNTGVHGVALIVVVVALYYLAVAIHEIGHAVAATVDGFAVVTVFVGPLFVTRRQTSGFRVGVAKRFGGSVIAAPRRWDDAPSFRRRYRRFIVAGPATSLAMGVVALAVVPLIAGPASAILRIVAAMSIALGLLSLVPVRSGTGRSSDGEKLRQTWQSWWLADAPIAALHMMMHVQRPRDWDPALLAAAREQVEQDGNHAIDASLLLAYHALDGKDHVRARVLLQRAIDDTCGEARWPRVNIAMQVAIEAALFEAAWRRDPEAARQWVARVPDSPDAVAKAKTRLARVCAAPGAHGDDGGASLQAMATAIRRSGILASALVRRTTMEQLYQARGLSGLDIMLASQP